MWDMVLRKAYLTWKIHREQWYPPEKLEKIQQKRLQKMVHHAYENTEFYRDLFDTCGVAPDDIKTKDDLSQLDTTTKADLQNHFDKMVATGYSEENCTVFHTSGSTGTPATVLYDHNAINYTGAEDLVFFFEVGYNPWEKIAYTKRKPWRSHALQNVGLLRSCHVDSSLPEEDQVHRIQNISPSLIVSYPTLIYSIARVIRSHKYTIQPKALIVGGEILTPHIREYVEKAFNARLFETYATVEFSTVAKECSCGNWHIHSTKCLLEFLDGDIVITGLINKALPLIRYNIEDMGKPKHGVCPCGRGYPMMEMLQGRSGDFFILPNGRKIPPLRVFKTRLILDASVAATRYQIIQDEADSFIVRVVPTDNFTDEIAEKVKKQLVKDLNYPVNVDIEVVDEIPLLDDRKLRVNICRIKDSESTE
jgi:phenylacetate-CoA ligase